VLHWRRACVPRVSVGLVPSTVVVAPLVFLGWYLLGRQPLLTALTFAISAVVIAVGPVKGGMNS
jgi:cation transport ATPase